MTPILFAHPFSSYCQKVLTALYENDTAFEFRMLDQAHPENMEELARRWPARKFPILVDGEETVVEATSIIEHLHVHHPRAAPLIPADPAQAARVRMMDRVFDNYVSNPQQRIVSNAIRPEADRDPHGDREMRQMLGAVYVWLDRELAWPTAPPRRRCSMRTGLNPLILGWRR